MNSEVLRRASQIVFAVIAAILTLFMLSLPVIRWLQLQKELAIQVPKALRKVDIEIVSDYRDPAEFEYFEEEENAALETGGQNKAEDLQGGNWHEN